MGEFIMVNLNSIVRGFNLLEPSSPVSPPDHIKEPKPEIDLKLET